MGLNSSGSLRLNVPSGVPSDVLSKTGAIANHLATLRTTHFCQW
ncbi:MULTISPECIES: hypothetical protein [Leptolyngbyaceae]|nr:hypothetical protein [Leptolyngbya sp. FACHB-321]